MGLGTFVLCDNLSRGDEEGCPCTGKRSVGRNSIQGPPIRTRRTRVLPSDSTSPSPSAPLPRGQSPGRAVPRQPVLPASTTRPSGRTEPQREPRLSPGSSRPRALAQPVSNRRLRFLSSFFPPPLFFPPSAFVPLSNWAPTNRRLTGRRRLASDWPAWARSRLPLLRWSKADKRRRLQAPATRLSQSPATSTSLSPLLSPLLRAPPASRAPGTDSWRAASARALPF